MLNDPKANTLHVMLDFQDMLGETAKSYGQEKKLRPRKNTGSTSYFWFLIYSLCLTRPTWVVSFLP